MTTEWTTLVQAETLASALGEADLVILDCRFSLADPDAGERAWRASHRPIFSRSSRPYRIAVLT